MDGKAWITGQNWIDQYQRNCARCHHHDTIRRFTNGCSVYDYLNDTNESFDCEDYDETNIWVDREYEARGEQYTMCV